jgi:hypothetical protein
MFENHCKLVHEYFINSWKVWYCFEIVIMYGQLLIFIDASVNIEILILKYTGEGEEGCDLFREICFAD